MIRELAKGKYGFNQFTFGSRTATTGGIFRSWFHFSFLFERGVDHLGLRAGNFACTVGDLHYRLKIKLATLME